MPGDVLVADSIPPDKYFKCHPRNIVGIVVCAICENVYHKSDFITKKGVRFISQVLVICDGHDCVKLNPILPKDGTPFYCSIIKTLEDKDKLKADLENLEKKYQKLITKSNQIEEDANKMDETNSESNFEKEKLKSYRSPNEELKRENELLKKGAHEKIILSEKINNLKTLNEELIDKNSILKDLNSELKQSNMLLKEKIGTQANTQWPTQTYTHVTNNKNVQENVPSIIIKAEEGKDTKDILNKIKESITNNTNSPINKILTTQNKIFIKCKNKSDVDKVENVLKEASIEHIEIEIEKKRKPRVRITGIDKVIIEDDLNKMKKDIMVRNMFTDDHEIEIVHKYLNRNTNLFTLIMEVNARAYETIMENKKIYIGYLRCNVYNDFNINLCNKCSKYGHSEKKCKSTLCCRFCMGLHKSKECEDKQNLKCTNCISRNKKYNLNNPINHSASDFENCTTYKFTLQKTIKSINYPYNPIVSSVHSHDNKGKVVNEQ